MQGLDSYLPYLCKISSQYTAERLFVSVAALLPRKTLAIGNSWPGVRAKLP